MKIISWNVRGIGKSEKKRMVRKNDLVYLGKRRLPMGISYAIGLSGGRKTKKEAKNKGSCRVLKSGCGCHSRTKIWSVKSYQFGGSGI
ncbi:unnamed protein product [Camellia sinensis]